MLVADVPACLDAGAANHNPSRPIQRFERFPRHRSDTRRAMLHVAHRIPSYQSTNQLSRDVSPFVPLARFECWAEPLAIAMLRVAHGFLSNLSGHSNSFSGHLGDDPRCEPVCPRSSPHTGRAVSPAAWRNVHFSWHNGIFFTASSRAPRPRGGGRHQASPRQGMECYLCILCPSP